MNDASGNEDFTFRFNNSDDADRFELSPAADNYLSGIEVDFLENNIESMVERGTDDAKDLSLKEKYKYIYNESMGGGKLDYCCRDFDDDKLYLAGGRAYDNFDAGNFVWGNAMSELGVPWDLVKLGSEFNGWWNGKAQNGEWSPGDPWYERITPLGDSSEDQTAIRHGYYYPSKPYQY